MNYKSLFLKVKEEYEKLAKGKKVWITILIVCLLSIVAFDLGCAWGEAIYYLIN